MATLRTVTVKPSGGDYSSLASAEAGEQGDLPTLDRQLDIECYAMADTSAATISGWTTDATRYVRIFTPTAERHAGVWSDSKYRLSVPTQYAQILAIGEEFVRVEGLQIEGTASTEGHGNISVGGTAAAASCDIRIDSCLIRKGSSRNNGVGSSSIYCGSGKTTIRNTVVYGTLGGTSVDGIHCTFGTNAAQVDADNCTVSVGAANYAFNRASGTMTLRNCYAHATTDSYTGTITRTTCAHSSASSFSGSTASVAHSTANFANVTGGSEDYHLVTGSALINAGTDLSGTFTTDIDGATRTGTWDIGADEFAGAATKAPPAFRRPARWFKRGA